MPDFPFPICGTALRHMDLLAAGDGDVNKGALVLAQRALAAIESSVPPDDRRLADALWAVGDALDRLERHDEAREVVRRALAIYAKGPGDDALASNLYNRALGLTWRDEPAEAHALYLVALPIADRPGANAGTLGPMLRGHGDVLLALGDGALAESAFRRALELDRSIARPPDLGYRGTAMLLLAIAQACAAQGKRDDADRYFESAVVEYARASGKDSSDVAAVWDAWALFCRKTGRRGRAHELERDALRVYRATAEGLRANLPSSAAGCARFDALVAAIEDRLAERNVATE